MAVATAAEVVALLRLATLTTSALICAPPTATARIAVVTVAVAAVAAALERPFV
jgi:hypothetical protein